MYKRRQRQKSKERLLLLEKTGRKQIEENTREDSVYRLLLVFLLLCICTTMLLLGLLQSYGSSFGVTWEKNSFGRMLVAAMVAAAAACIGMRYRMVQVLAAGVLVVVGISIREQLLEGLRVLANPVLKAWSEYYHVTLHQYSVAAGSRPDTAVWYLAFVIAFLVAWAARKNGSRLLLVLPVLAMLVLELLVGKQPEVISCMYLMAGSLPLIAYGGQKQTGIRNGVLVMGILFFGCVGYWGARGFITETIATKHDPVQAYQNEMEQKLVDTLSRIEGGFLSIVGNGSEDGRINNKRPNYTGKEVFRVTVAEEPDTKFYFRGFVGAAYENGTWSPVDETAFQEKADKWAPSLEEPGRDILNISYEYGQGVLQHGNTERTLTEMEILYTKQCKTTAYLPYYANLYAHELTGYTIEGDGMIHKPENVEHVPVYTVAVKSEDFSGSFPKEQLTQEEERFRSEYAKDVLRTYTKVPENGVERLLALADQWRQQGYDAGTLDINYAIQIQKVTSELTDRTDYSLDLKEIPKGEDVLENFLFDSKKGFCIHYASTATLLLRRLGVPARYVTGYAVDPREFVKNPDGTYTAVVPDESGHAWVEVFFEEQGWVPIEVTKGVSSMDYGCDYSSLRGALMLREMLGRMPQNWREENVQKEQQERPQPQPETQRDIPKEQTHTPVNEEKQEARNDIRNLIPVGILLFVIVAVTGGVKHKELKRKRRIYSRDTKTAVNAISNEIYRLLHKQEIIQEKNMPDEAYIEQADKKLQFLPEGEFVAFMKVVQRSRFSGYVPTKEEARAGRRLYTQIAKAAHNKKK